MTIPVHIVATGARTPVGLRAAPAAAAVRAGITVLKQHPFMVDAAGELMAAALDAELDPHVVGASRLLHLAETAVREVCAPLAATGVPCPPLPVYLGLPEFRPGFTRHDAQAVKAGFAGFDGVPLELATVTLFVQGHAAGLAALATAVEDIRRGACDLCLAGGVDSYFHPDSMEWLDANRQIAGTISRSGFVPGEGAGFCLLMSERASHRYGLGPLARVRAAAVSDETKLIKTSDISLGEGLTATIRHTLSSMRQDERINEIFCDINGERYRSEEWGFVCLRLSEYFDDPTSYVSPAECWGDMGAASGPLFAMLACQAATRGYAKGPLTLLWTSSEAGLRGVALIEAEAEYR